MALMDLYIEAIIMVDQYAHEAIVGPDHDSHGHVGIVHSNSAMCEAVNIIIGLDAFVAYMPHLLQQD
jgi:hypothetical protein